MKTTTRLTFETLPFDEATDAHPPRSDERKGRDGGGIRRRRSRRG